MRIRQVRPEFWTDEVIGALAYPVRLFYIGLWNVADDMGWLEWRPARIGAVLFPYESPRARERSIVAWGESLAACGRLVLHDCGCAEIPTLPKHQRVSGKQSFVAFEAHSKHAPLTRKRRPLDGSPVEEGNVEERNGKHPLSVADLNALRDQEDELDGRKLAAAKRLRRG